MAVQVFSFSGKRSEWTSSRYRRYRSKGIGDACPNEQICEDCTGGKIEKMSEPVQVYTACQFVKLRISSHIFRHFLSIRRNTIANYEIRIENLAIALFSVEFVEIGGIIL